MATGPLSAEQWAVRQSEVKQLVAMATRAATEEDRAAAAMNAADVGVGPLARTIAAVDTARQTVLDNVCNLDTIAYKAVSARVDGDRATFHRNFEQGSIQNTGRLLDVAVQGEGFLQLKTRDGVAYSRNGNLFVNNQGGLVLGGGPEVLALEPPLILPSNATDISIGSDGQVSIMFPDAVRKKVVGRIMLARFVNPDGLASSGGSLFTRTERSGTAIVSSPGEDGTGQLLQGFLESSNVDLARERLRLQFLLDWKAVLMRTAEGSLSRPARPPSSPDEAR